MAQPVPANNKKAALRRWITLKIFHLEWWLFLQPSVYLRRRFMEEKPRHRDFDVHRGTNPRGEIRRWLLPVALVCLIQLCVLPREATYSNDANLYLSSAAALAEGKGFVLLPYLDMPPSTVYPPLYSAYLACFWRAGGGFPENSCWLVFANSAVGIAGLLALTHFLRRMNVSWWFGALGVVLLGTSHSWSTLTSLLFSDIPFASIAFGMTAFVASSSRAAMERPGWWLVVGAAAAIMQLTRSAGMVVSATIVFVQLVAFGFRPKLAAALLAPIATGALVAKFAVSGSGYGGYVSARFLELGGWPGYFSLVGANVADYISGRCWTEAFFSAIASLPSAKVVANSNWASVAQVISSVVGFTISILAFTGAWFLRKHWFTKAVIPCVLGYFCLLTLWPFGLGTRAVIPCAPLILLWTWEALRRALGKLRLRSTVISALVSLGLLNLAGNCILSLRFGRHVDKVTSAEKIAIGEAASWLAIHTSADTLIAASRDIPVMHLYSCLGRKLLANVTPTVRPDTFYDVHPALQGNRTAEYALTRDPSPQFEGHTNVLVRQFGPFSLLKITPL
jgi:hypothetical protein